FGIRTLYVVAVSVISCVLSEYIYRKLLHKTNTIGDLSAVVTGILLALTLPVTVPLWVCAVGGIFAIVVVKQLYGGIGKNVVNPALAARVFLFTAFPKYLSNFTSFGKSYGLISNYESDVVAVAGATPLTQNISEKGSLIDLFLGNHSGCIGEISELLIIIGGLYLLFRKVITWHIPISFIGTVAIISFIFPLGGAQNLEFMLCELATGGLLIAAIFMATDYVTSPVTSNGRIIYGVGCGLITAFIRYFGGYPEGVSFAILIMNLLVWYIDMFTRPRVFGGAKIVKSK
ncbi:MAG: RnfABCDGE type electron transport complex subunit D, partial [Clostridia bacterium]|nr:RnfABCDGE type electron transport complex subunit D [Clostridia bacterium]